MRKLKKGISQAISILKICMDESFGPVFPPENVIQTYNSRLDKTHTFFASLRTCNDQTLSPEKITINIVTS